MESGTIDGRRCGTLRIAIFTTLDIQNTPWWKVLTKVEGLDAVLICRAVVPRDWRSVLRRFTKNLRKHGLVFVPYRVFHLARTLLTRPYPGVSEITQSTTAISIEEIESSSIHSPEIINAVTRWKPDLGLSIGAPILKETLFGIPSRGTINLHCAKLPDFRGAPPGFWELHEGAVAIGASVHWITAGLDTGDVIERNEALIYANDRLEDVEARAFELGRIVLYRGLARLATQPEVDGSPQGAGRTFKQPLVAQRLRFHFKRFVRRLRSHLITPRNLAKSAMSLFLLFGVRPVRDLWRTLMGRHPIRVYNYHRVSDLCRDGMTISPAEFAQQLKYITRFHTVIGVSDAIEVLKTPKTLRKRFAVITFDDGYKSVFEAARPIMNALRTKGCCFLSTDLVGTDKRFEHDSDNPVRAHLDVMNWDDVHIMHNEGWEFGAHSASHARLSTLTDVELAYETSEPMRALREKLDLQTISVAYPFGQESDAPTHWEKIAQDAGYSSSFTDMAGECRPGSNLFKLPRIEMGGDHERLAWKVATHGFDLRRFKRLLRRHRMKTS